MKKYDENGILVDGYNYYKHIAKDDGVGEVKCVLTASYKKPPQLAPDYDFIPDGKNKDQAEVFDCLMAEGDGYEELEDDFIMNMTNGKQII